MSSTSRQSVQPLETVIEDLFDTVFPKITSEERAKNPHVTLPRAWKPALSPSLGELADEDTRTLQRNRAYFRLDFQDFLDYATSELPSTPTLSQFDDDQANFYAPINAKTIEPFIEVPFGFHNAKVRLGVEDVVTARTGVFVSITMRFRLFTSRSKKRPRELVDDDCQPLREIATISFAPNSEEAKSLSLDACENIAL